MWNLKNHTNKYIEQNRNRLRYRKQTSGLQWGKERGEGQNRGRGLRGTNCYKINKQQGHIIGYRGL